MKELNDIISAYDKAVAQNKQTALATVVQVEGSSYRRPGARMLVTEDGEITGAISGGCLEGDALQKAKFAIFQQKNKLEIYDTTDEADANFGVQLGCNGIVYILFEPIKNKDSDHPINLLKKVASHRQDAVFVTLFNLDKNAAQKGTCAVVNEKESFFIHDQINSLQKESAQVLSDKVSVIRHYDHNSSVLFQFVPPAIQLVIAGAGNDVQPLVEMASLLGWNTTVADGRPAYSNPQRFPKANKVIVAKPADVLSHIQVDVQTAFVVMTHNYNYDLALLAQLLTIDCAYIGMLGPKEKLYRMADELRSKDLIPDEDRLAKIHGPVGLDIGAETAEEIAASIIAEIKAVTSNKTAMPLKDKPYAIHSSTAIMEYE